MSKKSPQFTARFVPARHEWEVFIDHGDVCEIFCHIADSDWDTFKKYFKREIHIL